MHPVHMPETMAVVPGQRVIVGGAAPAIRVYCGQCERVALRDQASLSAARTASWTHIEWVHNGRDV